MQTLVPDTETAWSACITAGKHHRSINERNTSSKGKKIRGHHFTEVVHACVKRSVQKLSKKYLNIGSSNLITSVSHWSKKTAGYVGGTLSSIVRNGTWEHKNLLLWHVNGNLKRYGIRVYLTKVGKEKQVKRRFRFPAQLQLESIHSWYSNYFERKSRRYRYYSYNDIKQSIISRSYVRISLRDNIINR